MAISFDAPEIPGAYACARSHGDPNGRANDHHTAGLRVGPFPCTCKVLEGRFALLAGIQAPEAKTPLRLGAVAVTVTVLGAMAPFSVIRISVRAS